VDCDVYTRAWRRGLAPVVSVEPGFRVHHVAAGPLATVPKEAMPELVPAFTDGVLATIRAHGEPDLIHANYWLSGVAGHALKHELGLPLVSTFHTLARVKAELISEIDESRGNAETEIVGCSDAILASSADERDQLERLYRAQPGRVEIVPPGVDHERFAPGDRARARTRLGLGPGPMMLFVGRIQPLKGVDVAIETVARLNSDVTLVIVGGPSGPDGTSERHRLDKLVSQLGVGSRVRFVAPQPHAELASWYRAANVCLVPSRSESFGLVALEAAACGTPVVAAAVGGLPTLVDHAISGFLVDGGDAEGFAGYVGELLGDPARAARMSQAAALRARRYSWSITAARLRRVYADLTARDLVECG
jgi:D-inositol-3-phosphate glycosyltransferase